MDSAAERLVQFLTGRSLFLAAAESCTAGLVADLLGEVPGASACFWGSFVCYTPQAKIAMLGVDKKTLLEYGLVSGETARAMVLGALEKSGAHAALSVTGLAGPGGAEDAGHHVPVGTIWIGTALRGREARAAEFHFNGPRNKVRLNAAREALNQISKHLSEE
ncbi:MAG: CinA family protein [Treponema sp.]|jgi:PncC family amidohydrolase|nr:CinA family protein [Treponema sp.]